MTKQYEPFNLERALAGEPVVTRNGKSVTQLTAFEVDRRSRKQVACVVDGILLLYSKDGRLSPSIDNQFDLFMKPKTHIVNGFEVPEPVTNPDNMKIGAKYYCADSSKRGWISRTTWASDATDMMWLSRNLIFLSKEDAIANAKAMVGIDPYGDCGMSEQGVFVKEVGGMKDDIKLPPLPDNDAIEQMIYAHTGVFIPQGIYDAIRHMMQEYSIDAIEPYKKRIAELEAKLEAVLKAMDELANGYAGNRWDVGIAQRLEKARAAIAKARGEE